MAPLQARPVQTLREHATAFEAALSVCLAGPKTKAVHKLRTESRRLEAQIALLGAMRGLPGHRKQAEKVLRHLARFRRAAGHVRDIDVQTGLLEEQGKLKHVPRGSMAREAKAASLEATGRRPDDLQTMIATREGRRTKAANELLKLIEKRQAKASAALEALLDALKPAEDMRLAVPELLRLAERRFRKTGARLRRRTARKAPSNDDLHAIRKAAKQTRYLAETSTAPGAVDVAQRYERLQEAGGEWHDWLDLVHDARKELGRKHALAAEFAALREERLNTYRALLEQFGSAARPQSPSVKHTPVTAGEGAGA